MPRNNDFISDIMRRGKETRQNVGSQISDFFRGQEPVEPTVGPSDIRSQQLYFEDLIRRQTEEDRRSGESDFPYPDEGVSPEEILMQQALQQGDAGPEPDMSGMTDAQIMELTGDIHPARPAAPPLDMGFSNPEVMRQILGDLGPEALGSPAMPPGEAAGRLPLRLPTGR